MNLRRKNKNSQRIFNKKGRKMRTLEIIENEIKELSEKLVTVTGTDTEVYTRIVGYYRSVRNWNKGKRDEYSQRKLFTQPDKHSMQTAVGTAVSSAVSAETSEPPRSEISGKKGEAAEYLYFFRTSCPNCPPVKNWLDDFKLSGQAVNVDEKEGFEAAAKYQIYSSPMVIFLDEEGSEMYRAGNVSALDALFSAVPV